VTTGAAWILAGAALLIGGAATHSEIGFLGGLILGAMFFFGSDS
jgi:hypothetical protein